MVTERTFCGVSDCEELVGGVKRNEKHLPALPHVTGPLSSSSVICTMGDLPRFHSDIKPTLISITKRTGMTVSQVTDEVLYTGLIDMQ